MKTEQLRLSERQRLCKRWRWKDSIHEEELLSMYGLGKAAIVKGVGGNFSAMR